VPHERAAAMRRLRSNCALNRRRPIQRGGPCASGSGRLGHTRPGAAARGLRGGAYQVGGHADDARGWLILAKPTLTTGLTAAMIAVILLAAVILTLDGRRFEP
jgi:hypothetical protein